MIKKSLRQISAQIDSAAARRNIRRFVKIANEIREELGTTYNANSVLGRRDCLAPGDHVLYAMQHALQVWIEKLRNEV